MVFVAQCLTNGSKIGIGLGKETADALILKIRANKKSSGRWFFTKVLVIDEISMVDGTLFDKLEEIARAIRNDNARFGGLQVKSPPIPLRFP